MHLVYSDTEPFTGRPVPYDRINATAGWLRHYENSLYLKFMLMHGTRIEKQCASKELRICERKMTWMERHPSYDQPRALAEATKLRQQWRQP